MTKPKIALLIGSLSTNSLNRKLAKALVDLAEDRFDIKESSLAEMPFYIDDFDAMEIPAVRQFKGEIEAADGILIVSPEYNRSITPALKNAIDWASRPYGSSSWRGKPAALAGITSGTLGTASAQQHLRNVLAHLDVHVMPQPEVYMSLRDGFFAENGDIADPSTKRFLQDALSRFEEHISRFKR